MAFGISFLGDDGSNGEGKGEDRFQEAVRVLSLRLPRVVGGSALAPTPLLQGQGGQGSPFLMQALAQMAGIPPQGPPQGPGAPQMSGAPMRPPMGPRMQAPTPRIVPGIDPLGAPAPEGPIAREWAPPPQPDTSTPAPHTGDPAAAAERSSPGYNSDPLSQLQEMFRRHNPWRPGLPI
jgi:hypothetical protein